MTKPRKPLVPIVRVMTQREDNDCSIACLSMLSGASYEDALRAVCKVDEEGAEGGLWVPQIIEAASELGLELRKKRPVKLEADQGILHIRFPDESRHVVVLIQPGLIVDTNGFIWRARTYLRRTRAKVNAVLVPAA